VNLNAGGFGLAPVGSAANYPRGWTMRHVYGFSTSGARHSLPCGSSGNAKFVSGGTFTTAYVTGSVSWTVDGKIGEKRANKL